MILDKTDIQITFHIFLSIIILLLVNIHQMQKYVIKTVVSRFAGVDGVEGQGKTIVCIDFNYLAAVILMLEDFENITSLFRVCVETVEVIEVSQIPANKLAKKAPGSFKDYLSVSEHYNRRLMGVNGFPIVENSPVGIEDIDYIGALNASANLRFF